VAGVHTLQDGVPGDVRCETLINCAGQWARQFGALAGVNVPLYSAEHFYIVTDRIDGVHPMLPVMRDPDGLIYYKEEVGGLVMGGFELAAKPWAHRPDPGRLPVPAARRRLGPVRAADDQRHPPHALPGNRADQDAAQRARELHARRQLHPGRSAGAARLLRLRRLQLGRHRQQWRRRAS
jgi:glycine/D-amino acid oxidase-like deaminating enzyme